jgi:uncharacterized protein YqeY
MTLKERITEDMKAAMRAKDSARLSAIRLLLAAMKQKEVDERIELDDAAVTAIIEKLLKQRKDSASQYEAANRPIWRTRKNSRSACSWPTCRQPFASEEVAALVRQAVAETGAAGAKDMGKVMAWLKPKLAGRADMTARLRPGQGAP